MPYANVLSPDIIQLYVGYCLASFGIGWGISFLLKHFLKLGEKI